MIGTMTIKKGRIMRTRTSKWTLVQHSGFGYNEDLRFKHGLETRGLETKMEIMRVERVGGVVFDSYTEAETQAHKLMYPEGYVGLIPVAGHSGTFSEQKVDGLRIFVPNKKEEAKK